MLAVSPVLVPAAGEHRNAAEHGWRVSALNIVFCWEGLLRRRRETLRAELRRRDAGLQVGGFANIAGAQTR